MSNTPGPRSTADKPLLKKKIPRGHLRSNGAPYELHLPQAVKSGVRAHEFVRAGHESPWDFLQRVFELSFDDVKIFAIRKASPCEKVNVRIFRGHRGDEQVQMLQQIRHENFVAFWELYRFQGCSYVILQHVLISLTQIVLSPPYPSERQLAAILGQVCTFRKIDLLLTRNRSSMVSLTSIQKAWSTGRSIVRPFYSVLKGS
jgi:hypothetical protein